MNIGIEYSRVENADKLLFDADGKVSVKTRFVYGIMLGVGIDHLYSAEELYELFFRMAVLHYQHGLLDGFFDKDVLFTIPSGEQIEVITPDDVFEYMGMRINDSVSSTRREEWLVDYVNLWAGMITISRALKLYGGLEELPHIRSFKIPNEKILSDAELFARTIMEEKGYGAVCEWEKRHAEFLTEFNKEKARRIPFEISRIPEDVLKKCFDHFNQYVDLNEEPREFFETLVQIAWCYANDMINYDDFDEVFPEYTYDTKWFTDPDGSIDILPNIYSDYSMYETAEWLKGM